MQFEYDPERLIEEVKKRPGIWDYENPEYRARNMRYNLWSEVVHELVQTDVKMSKSEMRELEIQLQKKWKSIRDCFQKYIVNPKRTKRPYLYCKQLQFLLKDRDYPKRYYNYRGGNPDASSESEEPTNSKKVWKLRKRIKLLKAQEQTSEEEEQEDEDSTTFDNLEDNDTGDFSNDGITAASPTIKVDRSVEINQEVPKTDEFIFASVDTPSKSDSDDPDKLFLISLLPHLKVIPEELKLNVKMELMQVLRNASYSTGKFHSII